MPMQEKAHLSPPTEKQKAHYGIMREIDAIRRRMTAIETKLEYLYGVMTYDSRQPWCERATRDPENPFLNEKTRKQLLEEKKRGVPPAPTVFEARCR